MNKYNSRLTFSTIWIFYGNKNKWTLWKMTKNLEWTYMSHEMTSSIKPQGLASRHRTLFSVCVRIPTCSQAPGTISCQGQLLAHVLRWTPRTCHIALGYRRYAVHLKISIILIKNKHILVTDRPSIRLRATMPQTVTDDTDIDVKLITRRGFCVGD